MRWGATNIIKYLWFIIPVAYLIIWGLRQRHKKLALLADTDLLPSLSPRFQPKREKRRAWIWICAIFICGLTLARPQWGYNWREVKRRGLDILVLLDTSNSMLANDIKPNRLQQAKWAIQDLTQQLHGDRIGLIAFAGGSFLQCPLTIDYAAFLLTLEDVYAGIIPRGGTDIRHALRTALDSFSEKGQADRVILLISDGESHADDPIDIIAELKQEEVQLYAIGVGTSSGELVPSPDGFEAAGYLKDRNNNVVKSSLNETLLEQLALGSGGIYVRAAPGDFGLERIYQSIEKLNRDEKESRMVKDYEERFMWFLGIAFGLFVIEASMITHRRKK